MIHNILLICLAPNAFFCNLAVWKHSSKKIHNILCGIVTKSIIHMLYCPYNRSLLVSWILDIGIKCSRRNTSSRCWSSKTDSTYNANSTITVTTHPTDTESYNQFHAHSHTILVTFQLILQWYLLNASPLEKFHNCSWFPNFLVCFFPLAWLPNAF